MRQQGQVSLWQSVQRAKSHLVYWRYRQRQGTPFPLRLAIRQWLQRVRFEWLGIGEGG